MASNLIVEDGTGKADASTYVSATDLRAYATARGVTLAADDSDGDAIVDQLAVKAMDYIEANRSYFLGWKLKPTVQRLQWPREGVPLPEGEYSGYTADIENGHENLRVGAPYRNPAPLPPELIEAQCRLVLKVKAGIDLMPTREAGKFVTRQKVGPIEREFSAAIGVYVLPQMPDVDALLAPLLKRRGLMQTFRA